ncbi:hypothetical protein A4X06_0g9376, partial [Tilletia controversa]
LVTWYQTWNRVLVRGDGVNLAIKAIAKNGPPPLPLRPPVSPDDLDAIFAGLDVATTPLHAAVWACATLSWWSMCRLGETTIAFYPIRADRHVMRSHLRGTAMSDAGFAVARIWLPWTKTTKAKGLDKYIVDCGTHTNAVFALKHHLSLSPHSLALASSTPLFAYKATPTSSSLTPLTKQVFLAVIDRALISAGRETHVGHSFRIGGATAHWRSKVPLETIKLMGGWQTDVVTQYLRDLGKGLADAHLLTANHMAARRLS